MTALQDCWLPCGGWASCNTVLELRSSFCVDIVHVTVSVHLERINLLSTSRVVCLGLCKNANRLSRMNGSQCAPSEQHTVQKCVMLLIVCREHPLEHRVWGEPGLERMFDICSAASVYIKRKAGEHSKSNTVSYRSWGTILRENKGFHLPVCPWATRFQQHFRAT